MKFEDLNTYTNSWT